MVASDRPMLDDLVFFSTRSTCVQACSRERQAEARNTPAHGVVKRACEGVALPSSVAQGDYSTPGDRGATRVIHHAGACRGCERSVRPEEPQPPTSRSIRCRRRPRLSIVRRHLLSRSSASMTVPLARRVVCSRSCVWFMCVVSVGMRIVCVVVILAQGTLGYGPEVLVHFRVFG